MEDDELDPQNAARLVVANRYAVDLDAMIGSGGMALVYRGRDLRTRRNVALKTLRLEYRRDPDTRARFRREMRTLAFLAHPNVVKIYDIYEDDDAPWAVMEYVEGRSLKEVVQQDGPLELDEVASVLEQTAGALQYLHEHGLVHLDVKPQNLIVQDDGLIKLIDFGLAQPAHSPQELIGGATFGTASYLSPEQASGEPVDAQTDVYSLGCVIYELITGRAPFDLENGEARTDLIRAHLQEDPLPPSQTDPTGAIPSWVDPIVLGALAKRPHDRYRDAPTFAAFFRNSVDEAAEERTSRRGVAGSNEVHPVTVPTRGPMRSVVVEPAAVAPHAPSFIYSARLRRWLWRGVALFLALNVALAILVILDRGELPPVVSRPDSIEAGTTLRVVSDQLNLRATPGANGQVIDLLQFGTRVSATGPAEEADGELWWPVDVDGSDHTLASGYVWAGGVEPAGIGAFGRVQERADRVRRSIGDAIGWTP
jgi:serine/threonine-protein kinase